MNHHAVVLALLSAALFGISTPAAKVLLGSIDPAILIQIIEIDARPAANHGLRVKGISET